MLRSALVLTLALTTQASAQTLTVAIETIDPTPESVIAYCNFSGTITNTGTTAVTETILIDHRLRAGTLSALTVPPSDGGTPVLVFDLGPGASTPYFNSMLGVNCDHLDGVNFTLLCEGATAGPCTATLVATADGVLPIQIEDQSVTGSTLADRGPMDGTWQVTGANGLDLMTLTIQDAPSLLAGAQMTFRQGADYCTIAAPYCDATPMEITSDRISLRDDGWADATLVIDGTSHRIQWNLDTGEGTFFDMQGGWRDATVTVTRTDS